MAKSRYAYTTKHQREELDEMVVVMLEFFNSRYLINIYYETPPENPNHIAEINYNPYSEEAYLYIRRDFYEKPRIERLQIIAHEITHVVNYRVHDTVMKIIEQLPEGPAKNLALELYKRENEFFIEELAKAIIAYSDNLFAKIDKKINEKKNKQ